MRYIFLFTLMSFNAHAGMLNPECRPSGIINKIKEYISPVDFWKNAINEIEAQLKLDIESFNYNQLVQRNDGIRRRLDNSEYRAMGIPEDSREDKDLEREHVKFDREMYQFDVKTLREQKKLAAKCGEYAKDKHATALIGW